MDFGFINQEGDRRMCRVFDTVVRTSLRFTYLTSSKNGKHEEIEKQTHT